MKYHVTLKVCGQKIRIRSIEAPTASDAELIAIGMAEKSVIAVCSEVVDARACNVR